MAGDSHDHSPRLRKVEPRARPITNLSPGSHDSNHVRLHDTYLVLIAFALIFFTCARVLFEREDLAQ